MLDRLLRSAPLVLLPALAGPALAQDGERALLLVDPGNPESMYVANYYRAAREIPACNVLYMDPGASDYPQLTGVQLPGFLGALANARIEEQVDFVVLPSGDDFFVSAPGLISDSCVSVKRLALPSAYTLARQANKILNGIPSAAPNHFSKGDWLGRAFQSTISWRLGDESDHPGAERYYIGAMLGWTGQQGNTLTEVLDMIDRSVAVDFQHPLGTVYYMETTDNARSGPRDFAYPKAVNEMLSAGGQAQHLFANLPLGNHDCMGVMTGLASPNIADPTFSLLDGSFADHLTSFAGNFTTSSQVKMSEWIRKGASGSAGTVEEPCNYSGKFPHARIHVSYFKGVTLGEAWFHSVGFKPFQLLLLGDPLTRPYGDPPIVDLNAPQGPVSGIVTLKPFTLATAPGSAIETIELFVDGVRVQSLPAGGTFMLDTTLLADGWHELRVRAIDDTVQRNYGRWIGELVVDNAGRTLSLGASVTSGDLGTLFDLSFAAAGGPLDEVLLLQGGRVLAASPSASGSLVTHGQNLGAGTVEVQAEARFSEGPAARSAPLQISVAFQGGGAAGVAPQAYSFSQRVLSDKPFLLMLPATFDDDPSLVTFDVLSGPGQASVLGSGPGGWLVFEPAPGASGIDTLVYRVTNAAGSSSAATITLHYVEPCAPASTYCVTSPNSVGSGALIGHTGSLSVIANDMVLTVNACPANQFGMFVYGQGQVQNPVGDGFLCIGSNHVRLPVVKSDSGGQAGFALDLNAPAPPWGQITVGSTWDFQFWYRDPSFGAAGFNFSDALEATFCP